jgi:hypothetical protein
MKIHMFAMLYKAKTEVESVRGLNFVAVMHTTIQVPMLPL